MKFAVVQLYYGTEYEGTVDYILGKVLEKDLRQGLTLGLQTVNIYNLGCRDY
jgi:hypothetical protein